jgi:hypothetical protein
MFEIEISEPRFSQCECCGGQTTIVTRFVFKDGNPFALYHATFSDGHPESGVLVAIGFDDDWEAVESLTRVAFACHLHQTETEQGVAITDWSESPWNSSKVLGRQLDRDEALSHPLISEVFHLTDHIFIEDPIINAFFLKETVH